MLDDNTIADWRSLRPLHSLSSLTCLSLSDNRIEAIPAEELSQGMEVASCAPALLPSTACDKLTRWKL